MIAMRANSTSRRVAVIGAGPSGLTAVKELLEEGHRPICFEKAASLGGVFRFGEDDGVVWESCRLTSSGLLTAFSDFPVTPELSGHMTARQFVDYLTRYCAAFDVTRHIRFGANVEAVTQQLPAKTKKKLQALVDDGNRREHHAIQGPLPVVCGISCLTDPVRSGVGKARRQVVCSRCSRRGVRRMLRSTSRPGRW